MAVNNIVFLATDTHYTAINNLTYNADLGDPGSPLLPARNAFEIITGPVGEDVDPIDQTHMGIPAVLDPIQLYNPAAEQAYGQQQAHEILRFQLLAE